MGYTLLWEIPPFTELVFAARLPYRQGLHVKPALMCFLVHLHTPGWIIPVLRIDAPPYTENSQDGFGIMIPRT